VELFNGSSTYPTSKSLLHATVEPKDGDSGRRLSDIGQLIQMQALTGMESLTNSMCTGTLRSVTQGRATLK
jgi:hypothetical protein